MDHTASERLRSTQAAVSTLMASPGCEVGRDEFDWLHRALSNQVLSQGRLVV